LSNTKNGQNSRKSLVLGILAVIVIIGVGIYAIAVMKNINLETIVSPNILQKDPCEMLFNEIIDMKEKLEELNIKGETGVYSQEEFEEIGRDYIPKHDQRMKEIMLETNEYNCAERLDEWVTDDIAKELATELKNYENEYGRIP